MPDEKNERWSSRVTRESNALDLEKGVFTWSDPRRIALSLRDSAEHSARRKAAPFRAAMSMLAFYINRAGSQLSPEQKAVLERAKIELRRLYGRRPTKPDADPLPSSEPPHTDDGPQAQGTRRVSGSGGSARLDRQRKS